VSEATVAKAHVEREPLRLRAAFWGYRTAEALAKALPYTLARWLFRLLGWVAYRSLDGVRDTVARNQARVLGVDPASEPVRAATREAFDLYARYWLDTFRVRVMSPEEVDRRATVTGLEHIDAALAAGRGCMAVVPHMGNWDAAGHWLATHGYPIASVAETVRPRRLFELFLRHRQELGLRIIGLASDRHVGQQLASLLASNWLVALVADRDLAGRGVEVEMFGATRRLPAGPALLSLTSGAPLIVCSLSTTANGWSVEIGPPLAFQPTGDTRADVSALTREMARAFERAIAAHPTDWHLFQPAWDA
jgi:KDO2-lipid IV(A) lauroyltransferase